MNQHQNINLIHFARELSSITGQSITCDWILERAEGIYYYIQAPEVGAPMLLRHYRGYFFVTMHPDDYKKLTLGEVSPHDYISSANWQVGYFWGGGNMVGGGYYQPFDIVNRKTELRRYLKILSCRSDNHASGFTPDEKHCSACFVENCPFSKYKQGTWENELPEYDPRWEFFKALYHKFAEQVPGYKVQGFFCDNLEEDSIHLVPNGHFKEEKPYSFRVFASEEVIRALMMRKVTPTDWDEYVEGFNFLLYDRASDHTLEVTPENIQAVFADMDYVAKRKKSSEKPGPSPNPTPKNANTTGFFRKLRSFLKI